MMQRHNGECGGEPLPGRDRLIDMENPGSAPSAAAAPPASPEPEPAEAVTAGAVPAEDGAAEGAAAAVTGPVWRFLIEPRWIAWHVFAVVAVWGMLWLGDWQLHRALGGNGLSWAYTFEWPLFSAFGIVFWARTIRDEFRSRRGLDLATGKRIPPRPAVPVLPDGIGTRQIDRPADDADDSELTRYNAYLARLNAEVKGSKKRFR